MNKSFLRTTVLIQSVQRQVQTLIERKDAYTVQVSQDWKILRWSRTTLLSDPAAKLIRMEVHAISDCSVSNPDPSNNWAARLNEVWNEHRFDEKLNLAAREVQVIWSVLPGTGTTDIRNIFKFT